jgi:hypothetical protein
MLVLAPVLVLVLVLAPVLVPVSNQKPQGWQESQLMGLPMVLAAMYYPQFLKMASNQVLQKDRRHSSPFLRCSAL